MAHAPHLERIVAAFGGQNAMARALGTSQGTIWGWMRGGFIPSRRIPAIIEAAATSYMSLDASDRLGSAFARRLDRL